VDVGAFSQHFQALEDIPIVKAAVAYDDPLTGETLILIIGQALYFGDKVQDILLNPNQLRANGAIVDDIPRHLSLNLCSSHSIYFPKGKIRIPLSLNGVILYFNVRKPTLHEINTCTNVSLTDDSLEWNPYCSSFGSRGRSEQLWSWQPRHPFYTYFTLS
jgi:hypothetical protein